MLLTTLPPEILYPILTEVLSSRDFKARDVARLASVCRTFYGIVSNHLYSNCDIHLHRRHTTHTGESEYAITLPRFNEPAVVMLANASKTLNAYSLHQREVKFLSLKTTRGTVLSGNTNYHAPLKFVPSLPDFVKTLASTFTTLRTLTITDKIDTPIPSVAFFPLITNILTTSLSLKHLNLHLLIKRSAGRATNAKSLIESLERINTPVANLESLAIDIHLVVTEPVNRHLTNPPSSRYPIWFLSSLPYLFPAESVSKTKRLSFTVTGHTAPGALTDGSHPPYVGYMAARHSIEGIKIADQVQMLTLPALEHFILSVTAGCPHVFPHYIAPMSYRNVRELEIRDIFELGINGLTHLILKTFPHLQTLTLKKIDIRRRSIDWRFIRTLKDSLDCLKYIIVYTKSSTREIETDLGPVFMGNTVQRIAKERNDNWNETDGAYWRILIEFAY